MGETILGRKPTEDEDKRWEAEKLDWQRFEILLNICLEHYISIDTKPDLVNFCKIIVNIADKFRGESLATIPLKGSYTLIGEVIEKAVMHNLDRRNENTEGKTLANHQQTFKSLVKELVKTSCKYGHSRVMGGHNKRVTNENSLSGCLWNPLQVRCNGP